MKVVQLILMCFVVFCSFVAWRFSKKQAKRIKELENLIDEYEDKCQVSDQGLSDDQKKILDYFNGRRKYPFDPIMVYDEVTNTFHYVKFIK